MSANEPTSTWTSRPEASDARAWLVLVSERWAGIILAIVSFCLGVVWAVAIRPLDAPDEPAHLQTIAEVRDTLQLPVIHYAFNTPLGSVVGTPGNQAVREYAVRAGVQDPYLLIPYEAMQPPLYYLVVGLLARVLAHDPPNLLYLARFVSVLFGALAVYFCWSAVRQFAPSRPVWAVATAGFVALLPQFCFTSATATNDSALVAACTASFYVWIRGLREPHYDPWLLKAGTLLGVGILIKLSAIALIPGLALVLFLHIVMFHSGAWLAKFRHGLLLSASLSAMSLLISGWWLLRNLVVYGDLSGSQNSLAFYKLRFSPLDVHSRLGEFLDVTWQSIWARFGWSSHPVPTFFYEQALYFSLIFVFLSVIFALAGRKTVPRIADFVSANTIPVMLLVACTLVLGYFQFSLTIAYQPQGRYLFPAILPFAMLVTSGLSIVPRYKTVALFVLFLWLAAMNASGLSVIQPR